MKRILMAAGLLLLGTSAPALAADGDVKDVKADGADTAYAVDPHTHGQPPMPGMGGPLEEAGAATLADLRPRPATQNYPACRPGPGDDSCIQLYEPGVRAQLASWDRPTGGLADGAQATAMGGPYEPVVEADPAQADIAGHAEHEGMGGPIVSQSGYPPCAPGPGDDRCIQLYERGVTGAGN